MSSFQLVEISPKDSFSWYTLMLDNISHITIVKVWQPMHFSFLFLTTWQTNPKVIKNFEGISYSLRQIKPMECHKKYSFVELESIYS